MAPALPEAAQKPCAVVRHSVGNSSAGTMNVVALGPKLEKKKVSAYSLQERRYGTKTTHCR